MTTTRRNALGSAATAIAALAGAQAAGAAASAQDRTPLSSMVAYQQEVVLGYEIALRKAPLQGGDRATLGQFQSAVSSAANALRKALADAGGTTVPVPSAALAPPPADRSRRGYLRALITAEEAAVASFYNALQNMVEDRHLRGAAAFMAEGGRRLVSLRHLAGDPLLPRSFETGGA